MFLEICLFLLAILAYLVIKDRKPPNSPPGPFEVPFLGQLPIFDEVQAEALRKKHGDIVITRTGKFRTVFLFDYRTAKEVMGRQEFTGRPDFFRLLTLDEEKTGGLTGSIGVQWQHDRRFVLRNLRNLGMGKSYLEEAVTIEAQALVDDLKQYHEEAIVYPASLRTAPLNIIWQMVASRRYDLRSVEVDAIYNATNEFYKMPKRVLIPLFFPSISKLPVSLRNFLFASDVFTSFLEQMRVLVDNTVIEHEKVFDSDNPRDLIDEYLKQMKEEEQEGADPRLCRRGALLQIINDLFGAGSDTIYNMLKWSVFLLARYPSVAEKLRREIDEVVPRSRLVSMDDKANLPYVEAFVTEALRFSSMVVMNMQRVATKDTTIEGYFIPKDTIVTVVNYHVHNDPKYWKHPQQFSPERFIDDEGRFQAPKEGIFAFGGGRRQCLGENLARMEYFLFTAAIAQNFEIQVPPGGALTDRFGNALGLRSPRDDEPLLYKYRV